jgi:hypothetical protein
MELGTRNSSEDEGSSYDSLPDSSSEENSFIQLKAGGRSRPGEREGQVFYLSINDDDSYDSCDDEISIHLVIFFQRY